MNPARPTRPVPGFRHRRSVVRGPGGAAAACARDGRACARSGCAAAKRLRRFRMAAALAAVCACCPPYILHAADAVPDAGAESPGSVPAADPGAEDGKDVVSSGGQSARPEFVAPETSASAPAGGREVPAAFGNSLAANGSAPNEGDDTAGAAAAFGEPDKDPVAAWKEALIEDTGLLARQSEISESILLIERQIRRAELLARLLTLVGPDAPVETAPGVFEQFGDSPAGRRIAAEMAESDLDAQKRLLELRLEIARSGAELAREAAPPPPEAPPVPEAATPAPANEPVPRDHPVLEEISGFAGTRWAVFRFGEERVRARAGDTLPNGARVSAIDWDAAELELDGERAWWRIER